MKNKIVRQIDAVPKPATFKETTKAVMRVAAYARVSTDHEDQQSSLEAQTDYYLKMITSHADWKFVKIYVDDGISGLRINQREGFNQMIEDCLAGHIDLVLTKSISRFARNTVDTVTTVRKLREKGIGVFFEKENIWSLDSKGEFLLTLMSSLAQEESRSISENVCWGQRKRFADGKVSLAYSRFLGYDKGPEKYTMVVNEEQAVVVRRLFFLFLQGYTPHTISRILTKEQIPTPAGMDTWNATTVRRILSNEKYKGDALLQKEFTIDFLQKKLKKNEGELPQYYIHEDHEAIVSPWLFDYVQDRLEKRNDVGNARYSGLSLFSSKLICGKCGSKYGPRPWHSTSYNNRVWQCHRRHDKGNECRAFNIYDKLLHFSVHDIALREIHKRKIEKDVADVVMPLVSEDRKIAVSKWLRGFRSENVWDLFSDEEDIAVVIDYIVVEEDGSSVVYWIDGSVQKYQFSTFQPAKHKEERQGLPKKIIKRQPAARSGVCENCGTKIEQKPKTKKRRFCCDECRTQWWNTHLDQVQKKAYYTTICQNCGKTMNVYGDSRRKYCSHECYIQKRFGK